MLLLQLQQFNLLVQCLLPVKGRIVDDPPDVLQRELQFPEQENLLQGFQGRIVIQPLARIRIFRRRQQTNPVIVLQGAYTHACQPADLMNRHHGACLPSS